MTIGIGHNLTDKGLSDKVVDILFSDDIAQAELDASRLSVYPKLDAVRQTVLIDMVFNMGLDKVLEFKNTIAYLSRLDFDGAADEMLLSTWAKEVGARAVELATIIRTGRISSNI